MNIKIKVTDHFTRQTIIDSVVALNESTDWATVEANQKVFSEVFPNCYVTFSCEERDSFICSQPYNMVQDEQAYDSRRMTWEEYCNKWYKGALSGCNEDDMPDYEIERQIDDLLEADWNERDSICH
jgi:hypothetical protein